MPTPAHSHLDGTWDGPRIGRYTVKRDVSHGEHEAVNALGQHIRYFTCAIANTCTSEKYCLIKSGVGFSDGRGVGLNVGTGLGNGVGSGEGADDGAMVGSSVGGGDGDREGAGVGFMDGAGVGTGEGRNVGKGVGSAEGSGLG